MSPKPEPQNLNVLWIDHVTRILGGAEINLVELLSEPATRARWRNTVACHPEGRLHQALADLGIERRRYGIESSLNTLRLVGGRFPLIGALRSAGALLRARRDLHRIVKEVRPSVVVSCTSKDHFAAWPACRRAGVPSVWWVNDILSPAFFPWAVLQVFRTQAQRGASRIVVVSEFARQALLQQEFAPERVVRIHNGIPLERYQPRVRGSLRKTFNLSENALLIGIVGRFTPWKGQDFFLRLADAWCRRSDQGQFLLIGQAFNEDQSFEHGLREFVRERGLRERVLFVPFQSEIAVALSDLDLLIHASQKPEPFGRVLIEAMSVGVPVIAARDGGVPEIITDGKDGLLAAPGAFDQYMSAMTNLLEDEALRERLREAGRVKVQARFSLARVRADFEQLFSVLECVS